MEEKNDIAEKIGSLLSDEESLKQITELTSMFMSGGDEESSGEGADVQTEGSSPDFGSMIKLAGLAGAMTQKDRNAELLLALRPHLGEEKQKRVDKAVKLLKLLAVWNIAKENGLLKDIM